MNVILPAGGHRAELDNFKQVQRKTCIVRPDLRKKTFLTAIQQHGRCLIKNSGGLSHEVKSA